MKTKSKQSSLWIKPHIIYIAVAFGFSWFIWIFAWYIAKSTNVGDILFNAELIWRPFSENSKISAGLMLVSFLSLVGVYGPILGAYVASKKDKSIKWGSIWESSTSFNGKITKYTPNIIALLAVIVIIPSIVTVLYSSPADNAPSLLVAVLLLMVFFVTQIFTSGTEEIGWRGYLTEKLLPGRDFWDTGWLVGFVWAVWHFPIIIIMFLQQGMVHVQILGSLAGFTMGIIAMSIIHTWFYAKTRQVSLNVFINALFNAVPLVLAVLYIHSPVAVLSNILLWLAIIYVKRRADERGTYSTHP